MIFFKISSFIFLTTLFLNSPINVKAAEMENDPTLEMKINAKLEKDGFHAEFKIPPHLVMNDKGPYSITFENFKSEKGENKADKSAFNFVNRSAFFKGTKGDAKKPSLAKMALFICDEKKTWCRRVLREVSF